MLFRSGEHKNRGLIFYRLQNLRLGAPVADAVGLAADLQINPQIVGTGIIGAGIEVAERIHILCDDRPVICIRPAHGGDEVGDRHAINRC